MKTKDIKMFKIMYFEDVEKQENTNRNRDWIIGEKYVVRREQARLLLYDWELF